ncbi:SDR family oxidoreductase [Actinocrispum sp. NPDC049592]|uniref:SDR family oxidoreductase n=1 Tax=Actinocrispum sp. NPDC049592 TaxID=3154835 RepID=UPI00342C9DA5
MDLKIAGRTAVVCASTAGLGEGVARALAAEGANVVVTGRRAELAKSIAAELPSAVGLGVDMMSEGAPEQIVQAATDAFGPVDILVLNGPGPKPGTALEATTEDIETAVDSLIRPQQKLVSLVVDGMRERGWGRILSMSSTSLVEPLPLLTLSNVGRAALGAYLKTLATQVAQDGVTVNLLLPGGFRTARRDANEAIKAQRTGRTAAEIQAEEAAQIPIRRFGSVPEFGAVAAFLCSDLASYITGTAVRCDGGLVHSL